MEKSTPPKKLPVALSSDCDGAAAFSTHVHLPETVMKTAAHVPLGQVAGFDPRRYVQPRQTSQSHRQALQEDRK